MLKAASDVDSVKQSAPKGLSAESFRKIFLGRGKSLLKIKEYIKAADLKAAYEYCGSGAVIIGGGAFLNLGDRCLEQALDLSQLGLDFIEDFEDRVEIGAMTCLRDIENHEAVRQSFAALGKAVSSIMGVQLRNMATIGGSICGKYGFSDVITVLLALNAKLEFYKAGIMDIQRFLEAEAEKDILMKVILYKNISKASFEAVKKTSTDFSILNCAAAISEGQLRLCVGARPGRAALAAGTMGFLNMTEQTIESIETAAIMAAEELVFGRDVRASAEYRKELCKALVKLCIMEVM